MSSTDIDPNEMLTEALAEVAMTCVDGDPRSLKRNEVVEVTAFDLVEAARCQTRAAAPAPPFQADMFTTTKTLALRSIPGLRRTGSALAAVSTVMREAQRADDGAADDDWLRRFLKESPIDVRSRVAARAAGWLTRTLEVLDVTDLYQTRSWRTNVPLRWDYPGRGLRLRAKVDLLVPDQRRPGVLLPIIVAQSGRIGLEDELGYLHLLWKSSRKPVPPQGEGTQEHSPSKPTRSKSVINLEHGLLLDHREAHSKTVALSHLAEGAVQAVVRATQAVTERERIAGLVASSTTQGDLEGSSNAEEWPQSVVAACFPSQLHRHPARFPCSQCRWSSVCDVAFGRNESSLSVGTDQLTTHDSGTDDHPAATPEATLIETPTPSIPLSDNSPRDSTLMPSRWALIGGIRMADKSSG